jgi:hypothetical protein
MNIRLTPQTSATCFLLAVGLAIFAATDVRAAENQFATPPPRPFVAPPQIDPATGLPLPRLAPSWKDPEWKDPDRVLKEVFYDSLPLGEVANVLRKEFEDAFDILIPNAWQDPKNPSVSLEPQNFSVRMRLKNVTASEVFNAMNLMFEAENTPCRWELRLNGNRPLAMLRVLPERMPTAVQVAPPPPATRMVYFVGDLVGDENASGKGMQQLVKTVSEIYEMSYGSSKGVLQFHREAQLIIVTGTEDQIQFVQQALSALREKARAVSKPGPMPSHTKAGPEETKPR